MEIQSNVCGNGNKRNGEMNSIDRGSFPDDFVWGSAGSAYQFEGAAQKDGRGPSIWDDFTLRFPEKITGRSNGNSAVDFYHQYKDDVKAMKDLGFDSFRFSISWSRILPSGRLSGGVNKKGVQFYNNLIDELVANGIKPFVTLFHWDLPQVLEDQYGGFLDSLVLSDFYDFADLCFWEFGDRVKYWITLNDPYSYTVGGYVSGNLAPGRAHTSLTAINQFSAGKNRLGFHMLHRSSKNNQELCKEGHPGKEPYIVAHNLLLAHVVAVDLYRQTYQENQKGKIGIALMSHWFVPYNPCTQADKNAADRAKDFMLGWFLNPLINGDYPANMKTLVGDRLPTFSEAESKSLQGSFDFVGLNYYTSLYAINTPNSNPEEPSYITDSQVTFTYYNKKDVPIGLKAGSDWLYVYPQGFLNLLTYVQTRYKNPVIYITENGTSDVDDPTKTIEAACLDNFRITYYSEHLGKLHEAMSKGVQVKGYFAWSFMDNFEWSDGYKVRFGLMHVNYKDGDGYLRRYQKESAKWFTNFLKKRCQKSLKRSRNELEKQLSFALPEAKKGLVTKESTNEVQIEYDCNYPRVW